MVQKRPHGEELYEVSSKQPRQLESSDEMVSSLEFPDGNMVLKPHALGEFGHLPIKSKSEYDERLDDYGGNGAELRTFLEKELETNFPGSISNSSWATSTTSEEDVSAEAPFHLLLSPDDHDIDNHLKSVMHVGDVCSLLFDYPPWKLVPIGSDFQAEVPEWDVHGNGQKSICSVGTSEALDLPSQSSKSELSGDSNDGSRFSGTCIIPMPDLDTPVDNVEKIGAGRIICSCEDEGSIRCVKQHITEAREKLRTTLGQENFVKLGFCDMGEVVTQKWSEEEELIFHEVVSSNRATLGKNFWHYLPKEFPSRTKNEIVSYYFNVFMLRKRALQNRSDPLNIDSDDDEWEGTDDFDHFVIENGKECDDSADSPVYKDDFGHVELHDDVHQSSEDDFPKISVNDVYEYPGDNNAISNVSENFQCEASNNQDPALTFLSSDQIVSNNEFYEDKPSKDGAPETSGHEHHVNFCDNKAIGNVGENSPLEAFENHNTVPTFQPSNQLLSNEPGGPNVQGGECTSGNAGAAREEVSSEKANSRKHLTGSLSGMGSSGGQDFLLEPCSSKEWVVGYLNCPRNEDFLPTCSMIEEVFGNEACNYKTNDS